MYFATWCIDKPDSADLRLSNRQAHRDWLGKHEGVVKMGGPLLGPDGVTMIGSLIVIEAPDEASARAIYAEEPYAKSGLFRSIAIHPFRWVVDPPSNG